jgi:hypothetical protein
MIITITDPKLMAELEAVRDLIEFRDPQGKLLNVATTNIPGPLTRDVLMNVKMLTPEEFEERRKGPSIPMEEVLAEFPELKPLIV